MSVILDINQVEFVKELYPRLREDDAAIERYRAAIDLLPPITVARGRVLVDGFHRWQAHGREGAKTIEAEDLGNLTDVEIFKESIRRNAAHGRQLDAGDKRRDADLLWRQGTRDEAELCALLSISPLYLEKCLRDAKSDEKRALKENTWDRWLNCEADSWPTLAKLVGIDDKTAKAWVSEFSTEVGFSEPPASRQHFDIWTFTKAEGESSSYFGRMPAQVVENLLWLYTEPGQIVVDPFAGSGTTIDVAKAMGRRVWASDRKPSTPNLPIHEHDITTGWPKDAPKKADLILLDPPYWQQAKGKYSDDPADLGNQTLENFTLSWTATVSNCASHLADGGRLAFIISPTQLEDGKVIDHAFAMADVCIKDGLTIERRIIVPYQTQQATGQQVEWAREKRRLLKLYRDLVVLSR